MAKLGATEDLGLERRVTTYQGVMARDDLGALAVSVGGVIVPARCADPLIVVEGDPVLVEVRSGGRGQGEAVIMSRVTDKPRPGKGTVKTVPASSPTITVTGSDGIDYTATFVASYTPTVNDPVILSWNAAIPSVVGKISVTAAPTPPPPPVAPPPPPPSTGVAKYAATDSDTLWGPGGWGSWAGGGSNVYQGDYGSGLVHGAWFYSGSPAQLAGRTITRIRFTLGSRLPAGANSSPVTVHVYAHTSRTKPSGDVSRTVGPYNITAQPAQGLKEYDLPLSFASVLLAGGGIAIEGNPYAGFAGRKSQPTSGYLKLDWSS